MPKVKAPQPQAPKSARKPKQQQEIHSGKINETSQFLEGFIHELAEKADESTELFNKALIARFNGKEYEIQVLHSETLQRLLKRLETLQNNFPELPAYKCNAHRIAGRHKGKKIYLPQEYTDRLSGANFSTIERSESIQDEQRNKNKEHKRYEFLNSKSTLSPEEFNELMELDNKIGFEIANSFAELKSENWKLEQNLKNIKTAKDNERIDKISEAIRGFINLCIEPKQSPLSEQDSK